jgi:hypothetical protein
MNVETVNDYVKSRIRKYDWTTEQLGYGVRLTVNDGHKYASVDIKEGDDMDAKIAEAVDAVDAHEYGKE